MTLLVPCQYWSSFLIIPSLVLLLSLGSRLKRFIRNYQQARRLQVPILLSPISWQDPIWMLLGETIGPKLQSLPFCRWALYSRFGWQMHVKYRTHAELGPVFVVVSPARNEVFIADPAAATEVLSKWKHYPKSAAQTIIFEVFGPNVGSVWNSDWARHRKLTAVAFKESNYKLVWDVARWQASRLVESWAAKEQVGLEELVDGVAMLSLDVLAVAGFGREYNSQEDDEPEPGHEMGYTESLRCILHHLMGNLVFQYLNLPDMLLPQSLCRLKLATKEFKQYMSERIDEERRRIAAGLLVAPGVRETLMSSLVSANEATKKDMLDSSEALLHRQKLTLSDTELQGNLFVFNLAGYETTAGSMSYAIPWLAVHEHVQEWVAEEVRCVVTDQDDQQKYAECFPRLTRCLAVLYETVRLHPPLPSQPRYTQHTDRILRVDDREITIPKDTYVTISCAALMTHPQTWGTDSLEWNPRRWIPDTEEHNGNSSILMMTPPDGTFIPWVLGPRVCQGKKFSQVEFVAAIAFMLKHHHLRVAVRAGETEIQARARLRGVLEDSHFNLTPKIARPRDAAIVWIRRNS